MLDLIDPSKGKARYRREGTTLVHAGLPHRVPAKAIVSFTTTDGHHQAKCEVTVVSR